MNKTELIDSVAAESGSTRAETARVIDAFTTVVGKTLKKGDEVAITGFGKFSVVKRAARQGRNPATGESLKIRASKAPKFTAGASLKTIVANRRKPAR
jgi:nucleoid DNA-binding protein